MLTTCRLQSGRYKLYWQFQPATHIMDWRGCNFRVLTVPGQPLRGFETVEEVRKWATSTYKSYNEAVEAATHGKGDGTHMNQEKYQITFEREQEWWVNAAPKKGKKR